MTTPTATAPISARGMSRCGLRASPPIWAACSKPCRANTTPSGSAANTPWAPYGANPPPAVKFDPWKETKTSTMTVSTGIAIFHSTVIRLVSANQATPSRLIPVNRIISSVAKTNPMPVRLPPSSTRPWKMWSR